MSLVYFKFLFINTIKRKPIWITWLLFLFTCTCFIIILPLAAKMNTLQVWANTTMAICQTFMGMVASLFTAVLAINVFKDTNEEGTELIIISKPISRMKIVLTKFFIFGFFCLLVNLTTVLLSVFTIFLPRTEMEFYWGLIVSMFIGNAITFAIFGSISILLSVQFAKVGIIIVNIMISLVFLIYQALTLFVFSTPMKILDDNAMAASSYIIHDRNTTTGEYKEDEVVRFIPSSIEGKEHPCKATNWEEMKEFWEKDIMGKDITPILNATDLAGQLALTYMSYGTDAYALRQAKRMFALSRFYNYKLTQPASPELDLEERTKSLKWVYTNFRGFEIPDTEDGVFYIPGQFGFEGIPPLSMTRLRGFTNEIPVGTVRSKEILSAREVYFEQDEWKAFSKGFDAMFDAVFNWTNYDIPVDYPGELLPSVFATSSDNLRQYYQIVWYCLMGKTAEAVDADIMAEENAAKMADYDITYFRIHSVSDINDRFIQFKNYVYWKILDEQNKALTMLPDPTEHPLETSVRNAILADEGFQTLSYLLGISHLENSWMMTSIDSSLVEPIITPGTIVPSMNLLHLTIETMKTPSYEDQYRLEAPYTAYAIVLKDMQIFNYVCDQQENYLFDSMSTPHRSSRYSGHAYMVEDTWYPNMQHEIMQELLPVDVPVGHNMQYFFYDTNPTINYWMFAIIWGAISMGLFVAGAIVYNKYDVK